MKTLIKFADLDDGQKEKLLEELNLNKYAENCGNKNSWFGKNIQYISTRYRHLGLSWGYFYCNPFKFHFNAESIPDELLHQRHKVTRDFLTNWCSKRNAKNDSRRYGGGQLFIEVVINQQDNESTYLNWELSNYLDDIDAPTGICFEYNFHVIRTADIEAFYEFAIAYFKPVAELIQQEIEMEYQEFMKNIDEVQVEVKTSIV
jgi:hypothetical protein